ncbi:MAG: RloB family protein [Cyanobacteria bacterium]|nr:RloB family protein [Cyanobacteriota bacterium]
MPPRRPYTRPRASRRYNKLFLIAAEGERTEREYFLSLPYENATISIECIPPRKKNSPDQVLKCLKERISELGEDFKDTDEAWVVTDKDEWTDTQLGKVITWSETQSNFGFALSNPKFEYWLLLHFEDGNKPKTPRECIERLKRHIPNYDKGIPRGKFIRINIVSAVDRARIRHRDSDKNNSMPFACTSVYILVDRIINHK